MKGVILGVVVAMLVGVAGGGTLNVPSAGYPTIQAGIDASGGDIVLVAEGTYN